MTQAAHYTPETHDHDEAYLGGLIVKLRDDITDCRAAAERDKLRVFCERLSSSGYGPPTLIADVKAFFLRAPLEPNPEPTTTQGVKQNGS